MNKRSKYLKLRVIRPLEQDESNACMWRAIDIHYIRSDYLNAQNELVYNKIVVKPIRTSRSLTWLLSLYLHKPG